jgi:hypothetical protein
MNFSMEHDTMSQTRKLTVTIHLPGGRKLEVGIYLEKRFSTPPSHSSTYKGRQIRMIKILTHGDVKSPKEISAIEEIVPWTGTVPAFKYVNPDTGAEELLIMDEKESCKIFKKGEVMDVIGLIDRREVQFYMLSGDHYFVTIRRKSKEEPKESDLQGYSLLHYSNRI